MKAIGGLVAGVVAAIAAMIAVGFVGNLVVPLSGPTDPNRSLELTETLATAPAAEQAVILLSWFAAAFAGAAVAKLIARASWAGWTIAGLLALLLAGAFLVPLPTWMQALSVIGPLAGGMLADLLVGGRRRNAAGEVHAGA